MAPLCLQRGFSLVNKNYGKMAKRIKGIEGTKPNSTLAAT